MPTQDNLSQEPWPPGAVALREYFEAVLREHLRATEIAEREREKAAQIIRDNLVEQIKSGNLALERHIAEQVKQVHAALIAQEKFGTEVQRSAKEAVEKALSAQREIAHKHNELIAQQDRDKAHFATKIDLAHLREVLSKIDEAGRDALPREVFDRTTAGAASERARLNDGLGSKVGRAEYEKAEDAWSDIQRVVDERLVNLEADAREQKAVGKSLASVQRERKVDSGVTIGQVIGVVAVLVTVAAILVGAFT